MADVVSPYECASCEAAASEKEPTFVDLLVEESDCSFKKSNLPVRVFFSKYFRFQQDKAKYPQFFCWPGISMGLHEKNTLGLLLMICDISLNPYEGFPPIMDFYNFTFSNDPSKRFTPYVDSAIKKGTACGGAWNIADIDQC